MMNNLAVAVGCNCPIHVQLRWVDAMQGPDSNPTVDSDVVVVVVDAANHANDVFAILIVDVFATFYPVDVVVYLVVAVLFLCDFAMQLFNVMLLDVNVLLEWLSIAVLAVVG